MTKYLRLAFCLFQMNVKKLRQYKKDAFIGIISNLMTQVASIVFLWVIFDNINVIAGWNYNEELLIYGVFSICRGLNNMFFDNLWIVGKEYIRKGTFDMLRIRPANTLFLLIVEKFQWDGIGTLVLGIAITVTALTSLKIPFSFVLLFYLLLIFLLGMLIIAGINLIFTVSSFWVVKSNNIIWIVFSLAEFAQYPLEIFGSMLAMVFTFIIPYGFISYYPVAVLLGKSSPIYLLYEFIVVIAVWIVGLGLWKVGVMKYESSGN